MTHALEGMKKKINIVGACLPETFCDAVFVLIKWCWLSTHLVDKRITHHLLFMTTISKELTGAG